MKAITGGRAKVTVNASNVSSLTELLIEARARDTTFIATTSQHILELLVGRPYGKKPSIHNYMGSIVEYKNLEVLILPPLQWCFTVPYGRFLITRYLDKFIEPDKFIKLPEFTWELFAPAALPSLIADFSTATFISCDIETGSAKDRVITCVGFTAFTLSNSLVPKTRTVVIPFDSEYNVAVVRTLLAISTPKVFQNGQYDNAYLLRFNCPATNWAGDTLTLFHSCLAELPKDLGFITAFSLRKWAYWKNNIASTDKMEYYKYNAKDAFATGLVWLALLVEVPDYAIDNYAKEFSLVFPCLNAELTGLKRNSVLAEQEEKRFESSLEKRLTKIQTMVGNVNYNPSSPKQTLKLFAILGSSDIKSTEDKYADKVRSRHPLNDIILSEIRDYRKDKKLLTSYLRDIDAEGNQKTWFGRIFYSLNPYRTVTGRLSSSESVFWCGWQMQNMPRDRDDIEIKSIIVPDPGFLFGEVDYSQNEARGTAYISGDTALIEAVDDVTKDFHGKNAADFFGIPYDQIIDSICAEATGVWTHKVLDKPLRQLSKNTNHGANYNMGPDVMVDTMGVKNVMRAKSLLHLPKAWTLRQVTSYLLERYAAKYKVVKGDHYAKIIADVMSSGYLVGPTGWTRRCFDNPMKSKHALNKYVAHPPQSLGAMQLNIAYNKIFYSIALQEPNDFKLGPQIHDSILFQYRKGRGDLVLRVRDAMRVPIDVTDTFGITRTLVVPTDVKHNGTTWSNVTATT